MLLVEVMTVLIAVILRTIGERLLGWDEFLALEQLFTFQF